MHRLVVVTGASRGIGSAIALEANRKFTENTTFLLMSRDEAKLNEVRAKMNTENAKNHTITLTIDFGRQLKVDELVHLIATSLNGIKLDQLEELFVFYNHGTMRVASVEQTADDLQLEFVTNVTSVWMLLAAIRKFLPLSVIPRQFHVNISSLLASKHCPMVSAYCSTRSARAALFDCLAKEQPHLRVLNYQPGPVYTDMTKTMFDCNANIYDRFNDDYKEGKFLFAETTVKRLMEILENNQFETGSTIDYFD